MNVTVLVDFDNDSVRTALEVAEALGDRLWGVRLDTSESLIDAALAGEPHPDQHRGVTPMLARRVRARARRRRPSARADRRVGRLRRRRRSSASRPSRRPVDAYGVGSSLLRGGNDFTADVVRVDGRAVAKVGREERPNDRLERVVY